MSKIEVLIGNIHNEEHQRAMLAQLNLYRQDPMGGVGAMDKTLENEVINGLKVQPNFVFFLAYYNNEIAGFANCFNNFSTFKGKQLLNIHDIAVDPHYRGNNIGRAIMDAIVDYCRKNQYCKVTLEVRTDNPIAQQLYKSLGFRDCEPIMHFWEKAL